MLAQILCIFVLLDDEICLVNNSLQERLCFCLEYLFLIGALIHHGSFELPVCLFNVFWLSLFHVVSLVAEWSAALECSSKFQCHFLFVFQQQVPLETGATWKLFIAIWTDISPLIVRLDDGECLLCWILVGCHLGLYPFRSFRHSLVFLTIRILVCQCLLWLTWWLGLSGANEARKVSFLNHVLVLL